MSPVELPAAQSSVLRLPVSHPRLFPPLPAEIQSPFGALSSMSPPPGRSHTPEVRCPPRPRSQCSHIVPNLISVQPFPAMSLHLQSPSLAQSGPSRNTEPVGESTQGADVPRVFLLQRFKDQGSSQEPKGIPTASTWSHPGPPGDVLAPTDQGLGGREQLHSASKTLSLARQRHPLDGGEAPGLGCHSWPPRQNPANHPDPTSPESH